MDLSNMIDEILVNYHEKHRADLERLIPLSRKVERVHADHLEVPTGLADFLETLQIELNDHMLKEEKILFPLIKNGKGSMAQGPIQVMMHEHVDHEDNLQKLQKIAKDFTAPEGACGSWQSLYQGVKVLSTEIREHIEKENTELFPNALNS